MHFQKAKGKFQALATKLLDFRSIIDNDEVSLRNIWAF